jgi:hypothetical protein
LKETTGKQTIKATVVGLSNGGILSSNLSVSYETRRIIRKDPTIALARSFSIGPIFSSEWSIRGKKGADEEWVSFIEEQISGWRLLFLNHALYSGIDFGWAPFEVVYGIKEGRFVLKKLKPLLQDITEIKVEEKTGSFVGYEQKKDDGSIVFLKSEKALHVAFRVEGTMWHGQALLDNIVKTYNSWIDADNGAKRYDKKVAGTKHIIYYPPGDCLDENGQTVDNGEMAKRILNTLEASGNIAVPNNVLEHLEGLNASQLEPYRWRIELLEDKKGKQPTFISRLKYLDVLKARGLMMPERSLLEGEHGTLSEASAHIDLALTNMDIVHTLAVEALNKQVVDTLLKQNFGEKAIGKVRIFPASLVDERLVYLQKVYLAMISESDNDEEIRGIDTVAMKELLGVPKKMDNIGKEEMIEREEDEEV